MEDIVYESFIRRCWGSHRFLHGANTLIWHSLVSSYMDYQNASPCNTTVLEKKYLKELGKPRDI